MLIAVLVAAVLLAGTAVIVALRAADAADTAPPVLPTPAAAPAPADPTGPASAVPRLPAPGDVVVPAVQRAVASDQGVVGRGGVVGDGEVLAMIASTGRSGSGAMGLSTHDRTGRELARAVDPAWLDSRWLMTIARRVDGTSVLYGISQRVEEAQGVVPRRITHHLTAADARTLRPLWTVPVRPRDEDASSIAAFGGSAPTTHPSRDGRFVLSTFSEPPVLVDTLDGAVVRAQPDAVGLVADTVVVKPDRYRTGGTTVRFLDAATGEIRGETGDPDVVRGFGTFPDDRIGAVATVDGSLLLTVAGSDVVALRTIDAGVEWRLPLPPSGTPSLDVDPRSGTALVTREDGSTLETVAVDPATGRPRWRQPTTEMCGAVDGRIAAIANDQLVTLDSATGTQLGFDPKRSQCPLLVEGGYSYDPSRGIVRFW